MHALSNARRGHILLVEDDARFALQLTRLLEEEGWQIERASCAAGAIECLEDSPAKLVVVDLGVRDGDSLTVVAAASAATPSIPSLVVTNHETPELVRSAIYAGAAGYLLKDDPMADYPRAIEACLAGDSPMSPSAVRAILEPMRERNREADAYLAKLSNREREVMALLGAGYRYAEVADQIGVTHGTVQTYVKRLYAKLDVNSKAEVAWLASEWKAHL